MDRCSYFACLMYVLLNIFNFRILCVLVFIHFPERTTHATVIHAGNCKFGTRDSMILPV